MVDAWDPGQYEKFASQRAQPFFDLLALLTPVPVGRVVDLGCGTGELTARLHEQSGAAETVGIDSSDSMLERADAHATAGLRFETGDIAQFDADGTWDVIAANASLHWLPDHRALIRRLAVGLRPGGQLAVQVPANPDHPSHMVATEVATESPFLEAMGGNPPAETLLNVLRPEQYAELLDQIGFVDQHVRLQVYGHHLPSTAAVAEWTKGTALTRFRRVLSPELFDEYFDRYRQRLVEVLGVHTPYFYAFKRILFWGRMP